MQNENMQFWDDVVRERVRGRNISKSMDISEKMSYTRKEELPDGD